MKKTKKNDKMRIKDIVRYSLLEGDVWLYEQASNRAGMILNEAEQSGTISKKDLAEYFDCLSIMLETDGIYVKTAIKRFIRSINDNMEKLDFEHEIEQIILESKLC